MQQVIILAVLIRFLDLVLMFSSFNLLIFELFVLIVLLALSNLERSVSSMLDFLLNGF